MNKKTLTQVPEGDSVHRRYLHRGKGMRRKEFLRMYPTFSKAFIYRHTNKPIADTNC